MPDCYFCKEYKDNGGPCEAKIGDPCKMTGKPLAPKPVFVDVETGYERLHKTADWENEKARLVIREPINIAGMSEEDYNKALINRMTFCKSLVMAFIHGSISEEKFKEQGGERVPKDPKPEAQHSSKTSPTTPQDATTGQSFQPASSRPPEYVPCGNCGKSLRGKASRYEYPKGSGIFPIRYWCGSCDWATEYNPDGTQVFRGRRP